jgi:hypothetical protein
VLARCAELGLTLIAHSPLGGPRRAGAVGRQRELARIAARHDATPAEVALAWLLGLSSAVVAIPGARRPESARSAARAAALELGGEHQTALTTAFGGSRPRANRREPGAPASRGEIAILMGIPGAGKSRLAAGYVDRGYVRLNRDERGGSLRALAGELDEQLASGVRCVVLDNTYLTRADRSRVIETAQRHALAVRCVWLETPLAQAQANLVQRLLDRFGSLPTPEQIKAAARREPWLMAPTAQMRALRELEPPSLDEGFSAVEKVPFARQALRGDRPGVFVGAAAATSQAIGSALAEAYPAAPHLLFDWAPGADAGALRDRAARVADAVTGPVQVAVCPHPAGPPICWCRPPLPGLPLAFAHAHAIDPGRSILVGSSPAHRTLAATLGARYVPV